ncbi:MAG TPA: MBL fold metallo-hydrolase [Myxococcota bacterium]|nr:MBL fold metallo-hydrolase [Myxococcota bacterium]
MARRQEQEEASTEVTEVAPDVLRMQLPIQMPGLGHVNCYALVDGEGAAVVDPGLPGTASWRALQDRLKQAGIRLKHVHTVIVTHSHPDHFGGATRFVRESGARVIGHRNFRFGMPQAATPEVSAEHIHATPAPAAASDSPGGEEEPPKTAPGARALGQWGGPTPWGGTRPRPPWKQRISWRMMRMFGSTDFVPEISDPVENGNVLRLAKRDWFVLHTPGHTEDHICLHDPELGIFLGGDHVLPSITPHISGISSSRDPLASFFYSLDRVAEINGIKHALPAHGHPFSDLRARTEAIKRHHYERLEKIRAISRELGPASVEDISKKLFHPRSWGAMAESETYAHLEHLRLAGNAESRREGELLIYSAG